MRKIFVFWYDVAFLFMLLYLLFFFIPNTPEYPYRLSTPEEVSKCSVTVPGSVYQRIVTKEEMSRLSK